MSQHALRGQLQELLETLRALARGDAELHAEGEAYVAASEDLEMLSTRLVEGDDELMELFFEMKLLAAVEATFEHIIAAYGDCVDPDSTLAYECAMVITAIIERRKDAGRVLRCIPTLFAVVLDERVVTDVRQAAADALVKLSSVPDRTDGKAIEILKLWSGLNLAVVEKHLAAAGSYALQEALLWLLCCWPKCKRLVQELEHKYAPLRAASSHQNTTMPDARGLLSSFNEHTATSCVLSVLPYRVDGFGQRLQNVWVDWNQVDLVCRDLASQSASGQFDAKLDTSEIAAIVIERADPSSQAVATSQNAHYWLHVDLSPLYAGTLPESRAELQHGANPEGGGARVSLLIEHGDLTMWRERVAPRLAASGLLVHEKERMMSCTPMLNVRGAAPPQPPQPSSLSLLSDPAFNLDAGDASSQRKASATGPIRLPRKNQASDEASARPAMAQLPAGAMAPPRAYEQRKVSVTAAIRSCSVSNGAAAPHALRHAPILHDEEGPTNDYCGSQKSSSCEDVSEPEGHSQMEIPQPIPVDDVVDQSATAVGTNVDDAPPDSADDPARQPSDDGAGASADDADDLPPPSAPAAPPATAAEHGHDGDESDSDSAPLRKARPQERAKPAAPPKATQLPAAEKKSARAQRGGRDASEAPVAEAPPETGHGAQQDEDPRWASARIETEPNPPASARSGHQPADPKPAAALAKGQKDPPRRKSVSFAEAPARAPADAAPALGASRVTRTSNRDQSDKRSAGSDSRQNEQASTAAAAGKRNQGRESPPPPPRESTVSSAPPAEKDVPKPMPPAASVAPAAKKAASKAAPPAEKPALKSTPPAASVSPTAVSPAAKEPAPKAAPPAASVSPAPKKAAPKAASSAANVSPAAKKTVAKAASSAANVSPAAKKAAPTSAKKPAPKAAPPAASVSPAAKKAAPKAASSAASSAPPAEKLASKDAPPALSVAPTAVSPAAEKPAPKAAPPAASVSPAAKKATPKAGRPAKKAAPKATPVAPTIKKAAPKAAPPGTSVAPAAKKAAEKAAPKAAPPAKKAAPKATPVAPTIKKAAPKAAPPGASVAPAAEKAAEKAGPPAKKAPPQATPVAPTIKKATPKAAPPGASVAPAGKKAGPSPSGASGEPAAKKASPKAAPPAGSGVPTAKKAAPKPAVPDASSAPAAKKVSPPKPKRSGVAVAATGKSQAKPGAGGTRGSAEANVFEFGGADAPPDAFEFDDDSQPARNRRRLARGVAEARASSQAEDAPVAHDGDSAKGSLGQAKRPLPADEEEAPHSPGVFEAELAAPPVEDPSPVASEADALEAEDEAVDAALDAFMDAAVDEAADDAVDADIAAPEEAPVTEPAVTADGAIERVPQQAEAEDGPDERAAAEAALAAAAAEAEDATAQPPAALDPKPAGRMRLRKQAAPARVSPRLGSGKEAPAEAQAPAEQQAPSAPAPKAAAAPAAPKRGARKPPPLAQLRADLLAVDEYHLSIDLLSSQGFGAKRAEHGGLAAGLASAAGFMPAEDVAEEESEPPNATACEDDANAWPLAQPRGDETAWPISGGLLSSPSSAPPASDRAARDVSPFEEEALPLPKRLRFGSVGPDAARKSAAAARGGPKPAALEITGGRAKEPVQEAVKEPVKEKEPAKEPVKPPSIAHVAPMVNVGSPMAKVGSKRPSHETVGAPSAVSKAAAPVVRQAPRPLPLPRPAAALPFAAPLAAPARKRSAGGAHPGDAVDVKKLRTDLQRTVSACHDFSLASARDVLADASLQLAALQTEARAALGKTTNTSTDSSFGGAAAQRCKARYDALKARAAELNHLAGERAEARKALAASALARVARLAATLTQAQRQGERAYEVARQTVDQARAKKNARVTKIAVRAKKGGESNLMALVQAALG